MSHGPQSSTDTTFGSTFDSILLPGETVLWSGRPKRGIRFLPIDKSLSVFGLFFLAISLVFVVPSLPWGLLIPHFWIGVYFSFGRLPLDALVRSRTLYVVTQSRAISVRQWPLRKVTIVSLPSPTITTINPDNTTSVTFGITVPGPSTARNRVKGDPTFVALEEPRKLLQIINQFSPKIVVGPSTLQQVAIGMPLPASVDQRAEWGQDRPR
jgi:hypothetical protein